MNITIYILKRKREFDMILLWVVILLLVVIFIYLEIIKLIWIKHFDHFTDHVEAVNYDLDPLQGNSLVLLKDQKWKDIHVSDEKIRSLNMNAFMPFGIGT